MICQHDTLLPNTTMQIQSNGQASRIICLECLRAAFITKRGMFIDADPPEHAILAPETRVVDPVIQCKGEYPTMYGALRCEQGDGHSGPCGPI